MRSVGSQTQTGDTGRVARTGMPTCAERRIVYERMGTAMGTHEVYIAVPPDRT
jgi:hypothetical protein